MELSPLLVYFVGQLEAFGGVCVFTLFLGGITLVFMNIIKAFSSLDSCTTLYNKVKLVVDKTNKVLGPIVFVAFLGVAFLPSRSTVAAMIVVPAIVNNENIQNISKNTLQWAEQYIKEQLNPKKEK